MSKQKKFNQKINPEQTLYNPLNNSVSKMQYTFSRSERFPKSNQKNQAPYYTIPSTLQNRSTTLGYGNKYKFQNLKSGPAPNQYQSHILDFHTQKIGISFGQSRQKIKNICLFPKSYGPGPGTYNSLKKDIEKAWTINNRLIDYSEKQKVKFPGPAHYNMPELINKQGKYFSSKYKNSKCPIIPKQRVERIKTQYTPGPSDYNFKVVNRKGDRYISESRAVKFTKSKRQGIVDKNNNPGPGQYSRFSDFLC